MPSTIARPVADEAQASVVLTFRQNDQIKDVNLSAVGVKAVADCLRLTEAVHKDRLSNEYSGKVLDAFAEFGASAIPEVLDDLITRVLALANREAEQRLPLDIVFTLISAAQRRQKASLQTKKEL